MKKLSLYLCAVVIASSHLEAYTNTFVGSEGVSSLGSKPETTVVPYVGADWMSPTIGISRRNKQSNKASEISIHVGGLPLKPSILYLFGSFSKLKYLSEGPSSLYWGGCGGVAVGLYKSESPFGALLMGPIIGYEKRHSFLQLGLNVGAAAIFSNEIYVTIVGFPYIRVGIAF